jgi:hypothetical protein
MCFTLTSLFRLILGDHCYKRNKELPDTEQMITVLPDIHKVKLELS